MKLPVEYLCYEILYTYQLFQIPNVDYFVKLKISKFIIRCLQNDNATKSYLFFNRFE